MVTCHNDHIRNIAVLFVVFLDFFLKPLFICHNSFACDQISLHRSWVDAVTATCVAIWSAASQGWYLGAPKWAQNTHFDTNGFWLVLLHGGLDLICLCKAVVALKNPQSCQIFRIPQHHLLILWSFIQSRLKSRTRKALWKLPLRATYYKCPGVSGSTRQLEAIDRELAVINGPQCALSPQRTLEWKQEITAAFLWSNLL